MEVSIAGWALHQARPEKPAAIDRDQPGARGAWHDVRAKSGNAHGQAKGSLMSKKEHMFPLPAETGGWPMFQSFQSELNRLFDRFNAAPFGADYKVMPALDVAETDDAIEVTAEMPGVKPEDLDVTISGQTLILRGQKSDTREEKGKDWQHVERRFGSFRRHVPLGFAPGDGKVESKFDSGVLTLRIAKPAIAATATRKIDIAPTDA
jgi:HSP20 family protein